MTTRKARSLDDDEQPTPPAPKPEKKPKKRKLEEPKDPEVAKPMPAAGKGWRFIVFTDLHVSARTIDRAKTLLAEVHELAVQQHADVICLGDFWDSRSTLSVRQLDAVQEEFAKWGASGTKLYIIPGNHDQVTMDGQIHAVRIFEAFPHIQVATVPMIDPESKIALLPWREEPAAQAALFHSLEGEGWTIFAHAEVGGAVANSGKKTSGHVQLAEFEPKVRACYLGHYHKRQKLGDRTWYIGSPFEQDFGERGEPHGIAIINSGVVEPSFIDLDNFPKHHRFNWPADRAQLSMAREQDIVELYMTPNDLRGPALDEARKLIKALDVRPLPQSEASADKGLPAFALNLRDACTMFIDNYRDEATKSGAPDFEDPARYDRLLKMGSEYLARVPDARSIIPIAAKVEPEGVSISNFCAIAGSLSVSLSKRGKFFIGGPMGVGKTSIADAITWALYGVTSPRKPGTLSSLKADEVVNDTATEAVVSLSLDLTMRDGTVHKVSIVRTKKRGAGAKITLLGTEELDLDAGISDTQEIIHRLIGLPIDLWRATSCLGQGAVANFVTDADKRRKELFGGAFGVGACDEAIKLVRKDLSACTATENAFRNHESQLVSQEQTLTTMDLTTQSEAWESQRRQLILACDAEMVEVNTLIGQIDPHLATEAGWLERREQYSAHIDTLTKSLASGSTVNAQVTELHSQWGAARAEKSIVERDLSVARKHLSDMMTARAAGGATNCPTCGQTLASSTTDTHIEEQEQKIMSLTRDESSLNARVLDLQAKIDAFKMGAPTADKAATQESIKQAQEMVAKCAQALSTLSGLKEKREHALARATKAHTTREAQSVAVNPFAEQMMKLAAQQDAVKAQLVEVRGKIAATQMVAADLTTWETGFSPRGVPVLVLRTALHELETHANNYISKLLGGRLHCRLSMTGEDLIIDFFKFEPVLGTYKERSYMQLSGGERRCVELAFSPFALSEMIFARCGVRIGLLIVDELSTHLDGDTKPLMASMIDYLARETVIIIDHDPSVQGAFDERYTMSNNGKEATLTRAT